MAFDLKSKYDSYLMGRTRWYEYGVPLALRVGKPPDPVLLKEPLSQPVVKVVLLVMDGVGVGLQPLPALQGHLVEHVADLVGVAGVVHVPDGADHSAAVAYLNGENMELNSI